MNNLELVDQISIEAHNSNRKPRCEVTRPFKVALRHDKIIIIISKYINSCTSHGKHKYT